MLLDIVFAFIAGLLTLLNPCVLPVLPVALASSASGSRLGPLALAAGMVVSFTSVGLAVVAFGPLLGVSSDAVARAGAVIMVCFGLVLLTPGLGAAFATATAGLANGAARWSVTAPGVGFGGNFVGGALLGAVWSPCIGPTLGGAIALASQGEGFGYAAAVMFAYSLGIAAIMIAFGYGGVALMGRHGATLRALAQRSHTILGVVFVALGFILFFGLHHPLEAALVDLMPIWLQDVSVTF